MNEEIEPENVCVIAETEQFFGVESPLTEASAHGGPKFEHRPQQAAMARMVAESFEKGHNLCVEAPTGVGKSFAYLVPAALFSIERQRPVVVSTETISLQEQLIQKDIPLLQKLLKKEFTAAIAKGRANYLCRRRLAWVSGDGAQEYLPLESMVPQVMLAASAVDDMKEGSRSEVNVDRRVWQKICCEVGNCRGPKCHFNRSCFYWRARREWDRADIIVANHALFFTDMKMKSEETAETSLLPAYGAVVFDEAHLLEDCASKHLGLRVSDIGCRILLNKLFDSGKNKGLMMSGGAAQMEIRGLVEDAHAACDTFFNAVREILNKTRRDEMRIDEPNFVNDSFSIPFGKLEQALKDYVKTEEDDEISQEASSLLARFQGIYSEMFDFLNMERSEHVYWVERGGSARDNVVLMAAPVNVATLLQNMLFSKECPVVLTSATLSVSGDLGYYRDRVGFMNGPEVVLDTPFDYMNQVRLYIGKSLPEPKHDGYHDAVCHNVRHFLKQTHGKAFVLFTSYGMMRKVAEDLQAFFDEHEIALHVQDPSIDRTEMLNDFRNDVNSVIFGTSSFWMGVDVPGEALSNVIITKLPFAVPSHPLIQARGEEITKKGKSPFSNYQVPEAVIKLKQGMGRLIRSSDDRGIIVILDSRIATKYYGRTFLSSIPKCPIEIY